MVTVAAVEYHFLVLGYYKLAAGECAVAYRTVNDGVYHVFHLAGVYAYFLSDGEFKTYPALYVHARAECVRLGIHRKFALNVERSCYGLSHEIL